jgi:hypothetical protein
LFLRASFWKKVVRLKTLSRNSSGVFCVSGAIFQSAKTKKAAFRAENPKRGLAVICPGNGLKPFPI